MMHTPAHAAVLSLLVGAAEGHGGLTTPLPRNSFNAPLDPAHPGGNAGGRSGMTNYYDDGCVPGCESCLHHGASGGYPSGAHGCQLLPGGCFEGEDKQENVWAAPFNVRCTVKGKPVGRGVYNVTVPGSDTLPDGARTWNRNATAVNTNPLLGDWGRFQPWRAPGASNIGDPCKPPAARRVLPASRRRSLCSLRLSFSSCRWAPVRPLPRSRRSRPPTALQRLRTATAQECSDHLEGGVRRRSWLGTGCEPRCGRPQARPTPRARARA